MTSPARIIPAAGGTNEVLPGVLLFLIILTGPSEDSSPISIGTSGFSVEEITFSDPMPLLLSSLLMTLASGHMVVFVISVTMSFVDRA